MNLRFQDPPIRGAGIDWDKTAEGLMNRPGEWAIVGNGPVKISVPNAVRQGGIKAVHPDLGFEVRTADNDRSVSPPTATLFMRYLPEGDTRLTVKEREKQMAAIRKQAKNTGEKEN